ncbi:porin [Pseudorhodobacter sp. MZDSW-24AT]|uniref:porin n=1 Tax=Pseudorhodobacter sp. MZDSW-24AT TaxID=2052957 RepID=UPI000C1EE017|nr:porin [Pseudorhodobacter sp. MZDSW-24AT]PJF08606.1 porin [Pseudorhodobacter sp. MZDSW-24AT]
MKKVLLASTVLAMSASVAAAEVAVSGSARMGVAYNSEAPNEFGFTSRVRVAFALSGESDSGLSFGASIRADNSGNGNNGTGGDVNGAGSMSAGNVFVSGAFGKLTMGDVDGAAELVTGDLAGVGLTGLGDHNENTFLSNGNTFARSAARYEYSTGGLTFALSANNPQFDGELVGSPAAVQNSNTYSIGVKYAVDAYAFGLGYETTDTAAGVSVDHIIGMAQGTFSGVTVKVTYGEASDIDFTQYGISASYKMDALGLTAYHRVAETGIRKDKFTGIGASYDLGGGASVVGGLVDVNRGIGGGADLTRADLGLSFAF